MNIDEVQRRLWEQSQAHKQPSAASLRSAATKYEEKGILAIW